MTSYTFENINTGSVKTVRVFAFHEALRKCKSENGWKMVSFVRD